MRGMRFALALALVGCGGSQQEPASPAASAVTFGGGDGSSCDAAVVVHASNEQDGVAAEYSWLNAHYPGAQRQGQALGECNGHPVDRLKILTSNGATRVVFFDISQYFGKM
jgi:hypothetical protein